MKHQGGVDEFLDGLHEGVVIVWEQIAAAREKAATMGDQLTTMDWMFREDSGSRVEWKKKERRYVGCSYALDAWSFESKVLVAYLKRLLMYATYGTFKHFNSPWVALVRSETARLDVKMFK